MSPEFDSKLCADFPLLYRDRHASPTINSMCYGFTCDDGWYDIVRRLSEKLERAIEALPPEEQEKCRAVQCKEKFGFLRFYLNGGTEEMHHWISKAEKESTSTCEKCGLPGVYRGGGSYVYVSCDAHIFKRKA